jgi:protein-disulfide isomerase
MPKLTMPVDPGRDHIQGPENAPVTLVEYGDFQCPHCEEAYPIVKSIQKQMGSTLRFVFRHFPITDSHPDAAHAAEASEAAAAQGKFWEMHAMLFEHQDDLGRRALHAYAQEIELDVKRFDDEMKAHVYAERVREDVSAGARSGVNGTPTFFINGERYDMPWDEEAWFIRALQEAQAA